jgi:hypothetical protein
MMKIFLLITLAMLCNCASRIELDTGWRQDSRGEKTCAIVLHPEKIRLSYLGKYEQLKADSVLIIKQNFMRCMKRQLRRNGYFSEVWYDDIAGSVRWTSMGIKSGFSIRVPYQNSRIEMAKRQPDYILILDSITIRSKMEASAVQEDKQIRAAFSGPKESPLPVTRTIAGFLPSMYLGTLIFGQLSGPGFFLPVNPGDYIHAEWTWFARGKTVLFRCPFVLWDVKQQCAVRWGVVNTHGNEGFSVDYWSNFVDAVQKELFAGMPFFKKTVEYEKTVGTNETERVTGLTSKISLDKKKTGWVVTNTIVCLGRDAGENAVGERIGGPLDPHRPVNDTFSFISTVSGGKFSAPFHSMLCAGFPRLLPSQQPGRELLQLYLQDQLKEYFKYDDKPLDTLGDAVLAHANADSLDYLVTVYSLYTYPDTGDKIENISGYDIRLYACLFDVKNNTSVAEFRTDLHDMLGVSNGTTFEGAIRMFADLAEFHLSAFLKL